mmetsp:Transcript_70944/g.205447  ORF Transcript_70944/g.205447 Transcript_70944/m.205447 type:complete len:242 (-) Transcript_70944:334-1059(-)
MIRPMDLRLHDVRLGYQPNFVGPEIPERPGHVQHWPIATLLVDAVVVAVESYGACGGEYPLRLCREVGFVIWRQVFGFPTRPRRQGATAVAHVSNRQHLRRVVVEHYCGGGAGVLRLQLPAFGGFDDLLRHLCKRVAHHIQRRRRLDRRCADARVFQDQLREVALDEMRNMVPCLPMPVEDAIHRKTYGGPHDDPRVLVGAVSLLALHAHCLDALPRDAVLARSASAERCAAPQPGLGWRR